MKTSEVLRGGAGEPLDLPAVRVGQLMQSPSDYAEQTIQFIKNTGMVTTRMPISFFVQDADAGVRVVLREDADIAPGDLVEVAGWEKLTGLFAKLVQAIHSQGGAGVAASLQGNGSVRGWFGIQENWMRPEFAWRPPFLVQVLMEPPDIGNAT